MTYKVSNLEVNALRGRPFIERLIYHELRMEMDFTTGIAGGAKKRISIDMICEGLEVEKRQGRPMNIVGKPSYHRVRDGIKALCRDGLLIRLPIEKVNGKNYALFKLPLADYDLKCAKKTSNDFPTNNSDLDKAVESSKSIAVARGYRQISQEQKSFFSQGISHKGVSHQEDTGDTDNYLSRSQRSRYCWPEKKLPAKDKNLLEKNEAASLLANLLRRNSASLQRLDCPRKEAAVIAQLMRYGACYQDIEDALTQAVTKKNEPCNLAYVRAVVFNNLNLKMPGFPRTSYRGENQ